jgi:hypothetical protein
VIQAESGRDIIIKMGYTDVLGNTQCRGIEPVLQHMADMELAKSCRVVIKQWAKAACGQVKPSDHPKSPGHQKGAVDADAA